MRIYFEVIYLLNFLLDFMILYGTKRILKRANSMKKIFLGSFLGSLTTFLLFLSLSSGILLLLKLILSMILIFVSFGRRGFWQNLLYFYLISILLGGTFYLFDFSSDSVYSYFFLVTGSFVVIWILIREAFRYKEKVSSKYLVSIDYRNHTYQIEGFLDTGNHLTSPFHKESVILVDFPIPAEQFFYIPYKALNTTGVIPCIRPDRVVINKREFSNCLVGLASDKFAMDGVQCILPNQFKEELC